MRADSRTQMIWVTIGIGTPSLHMEETWRWIKYLAIEIESVEKFVSTTGRLPALLSLAQYYQDFIINPPDSIRNVLLNVLDPASFHLPIGAKAQEALQQLSRTRMISGNIDVHAALEEVHRQATAVLADK